MTRPFTRKVDAIRSAKRIGHKYVLYRRTGARLGIYTTGDHDQGLTIVWTERNWPKPWQDGDETDPPE